MQSHLEQCRQNMVEQQVRPWDVLDDKVLNILQAVPRDLYVPTQYKGLSYADTAIPLNETECMMHPIIEGRLLQLLDIQPGDRVLEIGTGSGYLTACLAQLAAHVDSIEIDETLASKAAQTLQQQDISNISLSCADGLDMTESTQKYDVIVLCGAVSEIPDSLKQALNSNGRMFAVDGQAPAMQAHLISRTDDNNWADEVIFETVLNPLQNGVKKADFDF